VVLFNYATKEITAKVVYYGPGLCGKTTNLQFVYDSLPSNNKSKMLSLATKTDRTLFFDFLPLDLGKIRGMRTKVQLYTVPGQVFYNSTRQLVLKGADGVVFVADSQESALDANLESLQNLEDNLKRQGIRIREIPLVMQYNKRDLKNVLPVATLDRDLNKLNVPRYETVATTGIGVEETLKGITHLVLTHLIKKYGLEGSEPLDKDIQILGTAQESPPQESVWEDEPAPETRTASAPPPPSGEMEFELDAAGSEDAAPLVATELVADPFDFDETMRAIPVELDVELGEMPIPTATVAAPVPPPPPPAAERRSTDGLVKEVSIPLNLSMEELRNHRRLRLKITLDVNLLP
jgi:signal recognition particle receptor subunit beta